MHSHAVLLIPHGEEAIDDCSDVMEFHKSNGLITLRGRPKINHSLLRVLLELYLARE